MKYLHYVLLGCVCVYGGDSFFPAEPLPTAEKMVLRPCALSFSKCLTVALMTGKFTRMSLLGSLSYSRNEKQ